MFLVVVSQSADRHSLPVELDAACESDILVALSEWLVPSVHNGSTKNPFSSALLCRHGDPADSHVLTSGRLFPVTATHSDWQSERLLVVKTCFSVLILLDKHSRGLMQGGGATSHLFTVL